jgi:hypothetical protein
MDPWSITIVSGQPNHVEIWSCKNFAITIVVLIHKALALNHLIT